MEELHFEIYKNLRALLREADHLSHSQLLHQILSMTDAHYERYEELMLQKLVEEQMDPNHPRYDYGLTE